MKKKEREELKPYLEAFVRALVLQHPGLTTKVVAYVTYRQFGIFTSIPIKRNYERRTLYVMIRQALRDKCVNKGSSNKHAWYPKGKTTVFADATKDIDVNKMDHSAFIGWLPNRRLQNYLKKEKQNAKM
jgi:hypothetical protein